MRHDHWPVYYYHYHYHFHSNWDCDFYWDCSLAAQHATLAAVVAALHSIHYLQSTLRTNHHVMVSIVLMLKLVLRQTDRIQSAHRIALISNCSYPSGTVNGKTERKTEREREKTNIILLLLLLCLGMEISFKKREKKLMEKKTIVETSRLSVRFRML